MLSQSVALLPCSFAVSPNTYSALSPRLKMAKKNPCMEKSWNLKNDEISWKNHGIFYEMPVWTSLGFFFFPRSLDKY